MTNEVVEVIDVVVIWVVNAVEFEVGCVALAIVEFELYVDDSVLVVVVVTVTIVDGVTAIPKKWLQNCASMSCSLRISH